MRTAGSFLVILSLGFALLAVSCVNSSYERQGDAAYARARKLQGDEKQFAQKQAYQLYLLAITTHPNNIGYQLRSRFIEMSIARARMLLSMNGLFADPLQFFIEDIDRYLTGDMPSDIKQNYAIFLVQMADSFSGRNRYLESLRYLDKATAYANDLHEIGHLREGTVAHAVKENFDRSAQELAIGKESGNGDALVRAEYYAEAALVFDSASTEVRKLLSECRKKTIGILCDYRNVLDSLPDTLLFRRVEKSTIFLAVPSFRIDNEAVLTVMLSNYSNGALDLKQGDFSLTDISGKRYPALEAEKEIELVDQYSKTRFMLRFPKPAGAIAKFIFEKGTHYAEKDFF